MQWLNRLKNFEIPLEVDPTKPTKPGFVGYVGSITPPIQEISGFLAAANDPAPDPDRWCSPHSTAMNGREIEMFSARLGRFTDKGVGLDQSEALAERLLVRDREGDGRSLCLECQHLAGQAVPAWRCSNWERAGISHSAADNQLATELVLRLQSCHGFLLAFHLAPAPSEALFSKNTGISSGLAQVSANPMAAGRL